MGVNNQEQLRMKLCFIQHSEYARQYHLILFLLILDRYCYSSLHLRKQIQRLKNPQQNTKVVSDGANIKPTSAQFQVSN